MTFLVDPRLLKLAAAADARLQRTTTLVAATPQKTPAAAEDHVLRGLTLLGELAGQVRTHPSDHGTIVKQVADITVALLDVLEATSALEFMSSPLPRPPGGHSATLPSP